jgi:hypothetical protein
LQIVSCGGPENRLAVSAITSCTDHTSSATCCGVAASSFMLFYCALPANPTFFLPEKGGQLLS